MKGIELKVAKSNQAIFSLNFDNSEWVIPNT